jgi:hypothetical protein
MPITAYIPSADHVLEKCRLLALNSRIVIVDRARITRVRRKRETDFDMQSIGLNFESVRTEKDVITGTYFLGSGFSALIIHPVNTLQGLLERLNDIFNEC